MAARTSTGAMGRGPYPNTAISQYGNMGLASVVAALEALDLEHAPPEALAALLSACAAGLGRIAVRLATAELPAPPPAAEMYISVKAAAARVGVGAKWFYRRKKTHAAMREVAPGTWRVSVPALERWMARRGR